MVPQNEEWAKLIEEIYEKDATMVTRYAIKKEKYVFDIERLKAIVENVSTDYDIRLIDKEVYNMVIKNKWSKDLCSQF